MFRKFVLTILAVILLAFNANAGSDGELKKLKIVSKN